jgi:hypothetical protein
MELADDTYELVKRVPLASEITKDARYNLVKRLDTYQVILDRIATAKILFEKVHE